MVASVFNVLSKVSSSELPYSKCIDEIRNSTTSDIMEDRNKDDIAADTDTNGIAVLEVGSEILDQDNTYDYIDDLKSLSDFKKYKINVMCIENVKELGWNKFW